MKRLMVAGLVGIAMLASGVARAEPLVLMTWGGVWQKTFQELAATYKEKTGKEVTIIAQGGGDAGIARLIAQKGKSDVDLWTTNMINYIRALDAKVLEPLDVSQIPNAANVDKKLIFSHAITAWVSQRGIFYRKDLVPFEPKEWKDLWDPRLKGKIAAPAATFDPGYFPLMAALINGGNEKNLDPGFANLVKLKGSIASFYTNNVQSIRLIESGEVALVAWGIMPNVVPHLGPGSKYGFVIPKPALVAETPITMVAGTTKKKEALEFINFVLSVESQEVLSKALGSAPANSKAQPPESIKPILSGVSNNYVVDYRVLGDSLSKIIDRYDREIMAR